MHSSGVGVGIALSFMKNVLGSIAIADACRTDGYKENESKGINHEMPLAAFHASFLPIVYPKPIFSRYVPLGS